MQRFIIRVFRRTASLESHACDFSDILFFLLEATTSWSFSVVSGVILLFLPLSYCIFRFMFYVSFVFLHRLFFFSSTCIFSSPVFFLQDPFSFFPYSHFLFAFSFPSVKFVSFYISLFRYIPFFVSYSSSTCILFFIVRSFFLTFPCFLQVILVENIFLRSRNMVSIWIYMTISLSISLSVHMLK